jgi:hypothetical protein
MRWSEHGVPDEVLVAWVKEMWWVIWMRQALVNYVGTYLEACMMVSCANRFVVGMWKHRFEKEDAKAAKANELAGKVEQQSSKLGQVAVVVEKLVPLNTEKKREDSEADIKAKRAKILARVLALDH